MNARILEGKVSLITGAASGIGLGTAIRFAHEGAKVAVLDLPDGDEVEALEQIRQAAGGNESAATFIPCDVSNPGQVESAVRRTIDQFRRIDCVIANAGINGVWAPLDELEPAEWDKTHAINLKGTFLTIKYTVPRLRAAGGGSIIIVSSVNGNRTFSNAGASAYAASKAGQVALAKQAALELGRDNIRVNAVCPGAIRTNIGESTKKRDVEEIDIKVELPEGNPALNEGRGEPDDVARVCLFLASDLSRHVSGVEIYVDGGFSLMK